MSAPYSPKAIANAFLQQAFNDKKVVSQMKLQKLVYLAHGYYLASNAGTPLVDEPFEAWDYGPVCRTLYYEFRDAGKEPLARLATDLDWDFDGEVPVPAPIDDAGVKRVVDFVYKTYINSSAFALSDLTHKTGWAWERTRNADQFHLRNKDIDNAWIEQDFKPHVKKKAKEDA